MRKIVYGIFILLVAASSGYYVIQSQKSAGTNVTPTPTQAAQPTAVPTKSNDVREVIVQAVKTKQYSLLEPFLTEPVHVILYASECCGMVTKDAAIKQLAYLNEAKMPWIFDEDNETIKKAKIAIPDYFQNAVVSLSGDILASFKLNKDNKIEQIVIVGKYTQVLPGVP